jgi:hypothetical protein
MAVEPIMKVGGSCTGGPERDRCPFRSSDPGWSRSRPWSEEKRAPGAYHQSCQRHGSALPQDGEQKKCRHTDRAGTSLACSRSRSHHLQRLVRRSQPDVYRSQCPATLGRVSWARHRGWNDCGPRGCSREPIVNLGRHTQMPFVGCRSSRRALATLPHNPIAKSLRRSLNAPRSVLYCVSRKPLVRSS